MSFRTHAQRVCSLYKKAARCIDAKCESRIDYRYNVTLLRSKFDANKDLIDTEKAERLLREGEEELHNSMFIQPKRIENFSSKVLFEHKEDPPDWVLDSWYPVDQASYPEYFKRREQRKKEYVDWWNKNYGDPTEGNATKRC